ncbi:MAG: Smr/MutS family protein [Sphaerochaetaceae bacterium]|nr:Smr/MutS family protein [Spirochaetales bacterium]MDY5499135.1 Smr/MutS family protein [Sphaerochaetaceae bacterium]
MARKRKHQQTSAVKKEDEAFRPFSGINLKEKVTSISVSPAGKSRKVVRRNQEPVVGGYQKDADFGDILAAFEAGEDVASVSKGDDVRSRVEDTRSFADIFAEWEESQGIAPKKSKPKKVEIKKSAPYKQTKDFGSILSQFEGRPQRSAPAKSTPQSKKPSLGKPMEKSSVSSSGKSFGDLLAQYEGRSLPKKPEVKVVAPPPVPEKPIQAQAEDKHAAMRRQLTENGVKWAGNGIHVMMTDVAHQELPPGQKDALPVSDSVHSSPSSGVKASGKSFGELLEQFYQAKSTQPSEKGGAEQVPEKKTTEDFQPSPFANLYKSWSDGHDERDAIEQSKVDKRESNRSSFTIGQLRAMLPLVTKDMHGMTAEEAEAATLRFLADSWEHGVLKICIITGKGIHSQDGIPVVKEMVESVLHGSPCVREYASPKARYGGSGALWIILKEKD